MMEEIRDDNPIEVYGGTVNLTDVPDAKNENVLIPPVANVRLRIKSVKVREMADGALKKLNIMSYTFE